MADMSGEDPLDYVKPPTHEEYLLALEHWKDPLQISTSRGGAGAKRQLPQVRIKPRGLD